MPQNVQAGCNIQHSYARQTYFMQKNPHPKQNNTSYNKSSEPGRKVPI